MMLPFGEILKKYNIEPKGIIHVGAHWAEEHDDYLSYGINYFAYIEPCKDAFIELKKRIIGESVLPTIKNNIEQYHMGSLSPICDKIKSYSIFNCACGSSETEMAMYVSHDNQGQSNSLLEPHLHLEQHKEVIFNDSENVKVTLLDKIIEAKPLFNILAMDVQGYEGEVLKGATQTLQHIDVIYTEVNNGDTYRGCMLVDEMDEFLFDYQRVETYFPSPNWTWGDAVYIRKTLL